MLGRVSSLAGKLGNEGVSTARESVFTMRGSFGDRIGRVVEGGFKSGEHIAREGIGAIWDITKWTAGAISKIPFMPAVGRR